VDITTAIMQLSANFMICIAYPHLEEWIFET
jgi:hypothetical protein